MTEVTPGMVGRLTAWIGSISAGVTVLLTLWNAYVSNKIQEAKFQLDEQAQALEAGRDRISRFKFVQDLLSDLDQKGESQREMTTNLIRLALTEDEATGLFGGLAASDDSAISSFGRNAGAIQRRARLYDLIGQMDSREQDVRIRATEQLVEEYASDPIAIEGAVVQLEMPRLAELSANGRINVATYLIATEPAGWNQNLLARANGAVADINRRTQEISGLGERTLGRLNELTSHLQRIAEQLN